MVLMHDIHYRGVKRTFTPGLNNVDAQKFHLDIPLTPFLATWHAGCRSSVRRFGHSGDGGWEVCLDHLDPSNCVVYSFGISNDPSFDLAIADFGCHVFAFDPTIGRKTGNDFAERVHFYNTGLAAEDFELPGGLGKAEHKEGAAAALSSSHKQSYDMKKLSTLMADLGHKFINILKMDIEGYEWDVLRGMQTEGLLGVIGEGARHPVIGSILAEYHFGKDNHRRMMPLKEKVALLGHLREAGFQVFSRTENWRFGTRVTHEGVDVWNCIEAGMVLAL